MGFLDKEKWLSDYWACRPIGLMGLLVVPRSSLFSKLFAIRSLTCHCWLCKTLSTALNYRYWLQYDNIPHLEYYKLMHNITPNVYDVHCTLKVTSKREHGPIRD